MHASPSIAILLAMALLLGACSNPSRNDSNDGNTAYTVKYEANGATSGSAPVDATEYADGKTATVLGQGSLAKSWYGFSGWNTNADGKGSAYTAGATVTISGANVKLYAQWTANDWSALGSGMNGNVEALAIDSSSGYLYAGGCFATAGGGAANHIAELQK